MFRDADAKSPEIVRGFFVKCLRLSALHLESLHIIEKNSEMTAVSVSCRSAFVCITMLITLLLDKLMNNMLVFAIVEEG